MNNRVFLIVLVLFGAIFPAIKSAAQSRSPGIEIREAARKNLNDSLNFEERPYFLLIDQSEKALAEHDYESAGLRLVEAMSIEPTNPLNVALLTNLGMIYYYNEQDSLALVTTDEVIRRSPRLIAAHENRARILMGLNRDNEAYDEYTTIIGMDSLNTDARYMRGMMALYRGNLEIAQEDIDILNRVIPLATNTTLANATLFSMTGRDREAISLFRKLIDRDKLPEYYSALVGCLLAVDDLTEASKYIGEGLAMFPRDAELYYYRAILNKKRYMPDDAHRDAKLALEYGASPAKVQSIFK